MGLGLLGAVFRSKEGLLSRLCEDIIMRMTHLSDYRLKQWLASALSSALLVQSAILPAGASPTRLGATPLLPPTQIARLVSGSLDGHPKIILIEDLHFNYSVQKNIARLLQFLSDHDAIGKVVAVEGATGQVDNSPLAQVKNRRVREELADFLLQNGELTGTQFYSVMSDQPKILQGVEDAAYFQANREIFKKSYKKRETALWEVRQLRKKVLSVIPTLANRSVERLLSAQRRFESGALNIHRYWSLLDRQGQKAGIDRPDILTDYLSATPEHRSQLLLTSDLYQALNDYALRVQSRLATSAPERNAIAVLQELALADRVLSQHATLAEVRYLSGRTERLTELIQLLIHDAAPSLGTANADLKEALRASTDYYVAALMRNDPMLENTLKLHAANQAANRPMVLVVGGFHAPYFAQEFQRRSIPFAVFAPQIDSHTSDDETLYARRFMGERMTAREMLEWFKAHGRTRGSPTAINSAGLIPPLQDLHWLEALRKDSEVNGSIYGKDSRGVRFLSELRKSGYEDLNFEGKRINIRHLDDLKNPDFKDPIIPHADALKAVLYILITSEIGIPIDSLEFTESEQVNTKLQSERFSIRLPDAVKETLIEMQETSPGSGRYNALIHVQALKAHPIFQKNPFKFYLLLGLHEIAEYREGGVSHEELERDQLGGVTTREIPVTEMLRKFSRHIPDLAAALIQNHELRAMVEFYDRIFPYIAEQRVTQGRDLSLGNLLGTDIDDVTSFAYRTFLTPGTDFRPALPEDVKALPAKLPPNLIHEATRTELEGRVIKQIYAGGDMSRMKKDLKANDIQLPVEEFESMFLLRLGRITRGVPDAVHWGGRQMIRLNQSVRRLARENRGFGISETRALKNQNIVVHVKEATLKWIVQDFVDHGFYGFNPRRIYFLPSRIYHDYKYDAELGLYVIDAGKTSVLGNGAGHEVLGFPDTAVVVVSNDYEHVIPIKSSALRAIISEYPDEKDRLIIRQMRINDLKTLEANNISIERIAYWLGRMEQGHFIVNEMIENPPLVTIKNGEREIKIQKGGGLDVRNTREGKRLFMTETISKRDALSMALAERARIEAEQRGDRPLVNLMGWGADARALAADLEKVGLPAHFEPEFTDGKKEDTRESRNRPFTYIRGQYVAGDETWDEHGLNPDFYYEPGAILTDLKLMGTDTLDHLGSQLQVAKDKIDEFDNDPEALALAALHGFEIQLGPNVMVEQVEHELDRIRENAKDPRVTVKVETARAIIRQAGRVPTRGALRATEVHAFAGIAGAALGASILMHAPIAGVAVLGAFAIAAVGQEVAVLAHAIAARDWKSIVSKDPIAWYDFVTQMEDSSKVPLVGRTFAHAHELARALTQSRGSVVPRLIAPITLAVAIVDDLAAGLMMLFMHIRGIPLPDTEMMKALDTHGEQIAALLEQTKSAPSVASRAWARVMVGVAAVNKNSNARRTAAEMAARQELSSAA
jgi:hypothetical protein